MITTLIVDDELFARQALRRALEPETDIQILGECGNAIEALARIQAEKPDVVFLDIQMPQITGIEMLAMLDAESMPHIVFLTAYDEFAVKAFEKNAFDYLLKPVTAERLALTLQRLRDSAGTVQQDYSVLPEARRLRQIPCFIQHDVIFLKLDEIECVESRASGIYVSDTQGNERQFLVNLDLVQRLRYLEGGLAEFVMRRGRAIPISRRLLPDIKERLGIV